MEEYRLQGLVTNFSLNEFTEQNIASCSGLNLACAFLKQTHHILSFVLAYLSVFQRHSEVLETSVLLDENNEMRSECFVQWAASTIDASSTTTFESTKIVT